MIQPKVLTKAFAQDADPDTINQIPDNREPTTPPQNATWDKGFTRDVMQPAEVGGLPPQGQDFNGIFKEITEHSAYVSQGGLYKFSQEIAGGDGYHKGAVLISDDGTKSYRSNIDNNKVNFNTTPNSIGNQWSVYSVTFGNTKGTVCEGNDQRLSNARDWNASIVTQAEAEAGIATTARKWTAQRVRQAIVAWWETIGTAFGKTLLGSANAAAARGSLGLGTAATKDVGTGAGNVMEVGAFGLGASNGFRSYELPVFSFGQDGVNDEYLIVCRYHTSGAVSATGVMGDIYFQRGSGSTSNMSNRLSISALDAYTGTIFKAALSVDSISPPRFLHADIISVSGVQYVALRGALSGGPHTYANFLLGKVFGNDPLILTRVRESDANVTVDITNYAPIAYALSSSNILTTTGQSTEYPMSQKAVTDAINAVGVGAGTSSTALGLNATASGLFSTALGNIANASRTSSTALGHGATASGLFSTALGYGATASGESSTALGRGAATDGDFQIQIGQQTGDYSPSAVYSAKAITVRSDQNDKSDIRDIDLGLDFVMQLRPVKFKYDYQSEYLPERPDDFYEWSKEDQDDWHEERSHMLNNGLVEKDGTHKGSREQEGFLYQQVKAVADSMGTDFSGLVDATVNGGSKYANKSLAHEKFIAPMVKAIQEQQSIIESLNDRVDTLENTSQQQQSIIESLTIRLEALETNA